MIPFVELALALAATTAAPQHDGAAKVAARTPTRSASATAQQHAVACRKAHKNYNAKTDSYRDVRGQRQRCTR